MKSKYNEELFGRGLRKQLHLGRYKWISKELGKLKYNSVFELGCYDGKLIEYIPEKNIIYLGVDSNDEDVYWNSGLDIANKVYGDRDQKYRFLECKSVNQLPNKKNEFDISVCMETYEHVLPTEVDNYLSRMSLITKKFCFITVPNEIGPVFFFKWATKYLIGCPRKFSPSEFFFHLIGKTNKINIPPGNHGHKGFGHNQFLRQVQRYFSIVKIVGIPLQFVPPYFNFGIGIIAKPI